MDIILVPGLWLDASSWDGVAPALEAAGHRVHPLTMPGVGGPAAETAEIGIGDWVDAVAERIDRIGGPVVLVGHSGGGNVVWGAAGARPDRVARVILLDTIVPNDGGSIWEFPIVDGVVPFPGWDSFEEEEVGDLDDQTRADASARVKSVPARIPTDPVSLGDERRRSVPVTMLTGTMPASQVRGVLADPPAWATELAAIEDLEVVDLHSGHWPQFSKPDEVAAAILTAVGR
ncbi:alpha/beta hydrolase [Microbacterium sp. BK668]|uniref:alpha/beta fold hydrolase n=1 Tax=Microbacterium sp. BK668 TaxID=2512118 RepID=UPI0010608A1A|nr:alpha/beta hydrolase [Microbacterium sp. BK668]TDN93052.1 pimeloyl-ACP methyl ester carboxylesterase [Microbacterium sp. BK668]